MVADYNARSDAHDRGVAEHNRRVADMNAVVSQVTADMADASAYRGPISWSTLR